MTESDNPSQLAVFAASLIPVGVSELSNGYGDLVRTLRANTALGELARAKGIDAVLDSDDDAIAGLRKKNNELATDAERRAEKLMRDEVQRAYPHHGIVGEELGKTAGREYLWVFDPIDGTSAMVRTAMAEAFELPVGNPVPAFGVTIAVVTADDAIVGVVAELCAKDGGLVVVNTWVGANGQPTTLDGEPVRVPPVKPLASATLASTVPEVMFTTAQTWGAFQALQEATHAFVPDQNCVGFMRVLGGDIDIVMEADLTLPDAGALVPILRNAGVVVTDIQGDVVRFEEDARDGEYPLLVAAQPLHEAALQVIRGGVDPARNTFSDRGTLLSGYAQKFSH